MSSSLPIDTSSPARRALPSIDLALFIWHWLLAAAVTLSLATGLRIAADAPALAMAAAAPPDAWLIRALQPWLPQGEVFGLHRLAAYALGFGLAGYLLWLLASGQISRLLIPLRRAPSWRQRLAVIVIWIGLLLIFAALVSGVLLYLEPIPLPRDLLSTLHRFLAWSLLLFVLMHLLAHAVAGGLRPFLRIVRPAFRRLGVGVFAATVAALLVAALAFLEAEFPRQLTLQRVSTPPLIDGDLRDAAWAISPATLVETHRGANLGGAGRPGSVAVSIRALHDGESAYFLFEWSDATESRKHWPLIKTGEGWQVLNEGLLQADEDRYYEDKFAVMLSRGGEIAGDGSIHLGAKPLADHPAPQGGRGLHYTAPGELVDVWHWKSVRTSALGRADDSYFGPPRPSRSEWKRYTGGYYPDVECEHPLIYRRGDWSPNPECGVGSRYNWPPGPASESVTPRRLPVDQRHFRSMESMELSPLLSDRWVGYLRWAQTIPYADHLDTQPVGTIMPSLLSTGELAPDRDDVTAAASWYGGRWHLEMRRQLDTGSEQDLAIADGIHLWVAVFDHTQTRHSYHLRPLRLRLE